MAQKPFVVVDTNILFSALLVAQSTWAEVILNDAEHTFVICEAVVVELFEHKERIVQISKLPIESVIAAYHDLLRTVTLYKENWIAPENWRRAYALCTDVDEDDTPHVALALELNALLWTGDRRLKAGLQAKGFDRFFAPPTS